MLKLCGCNDNFQLGEKVNNERMSISPPVNSKLDASYLSSYSVYHEHSVVITKNSEILAVGSNEGGKIIGSLPKQKFTEFTKFSIKDQNGRTMNPISAVCGYNYTLYLVSSSKNNDETKLVYSYDGITTNSLFLNIGNSRPVSLFGGSGTAAAIDEEGHIIFVPKSSLVKTLSSSKLDQSRLPNGERATSVCCCSTSIYAVGASGRAFVSSIPSQGNILEFKPVESLNDKKICEVSGTNDHCLAVTEDGKVFSCGSNELGKLGLGQKIKETSQFTMIVCLFNYRIIHAYAGFSHSLFQTEDGQLLACGCGYYGELLTSKPIDTIAHIPIKTEITGGATFCIAGNCSSSVFIDYDPLKSPNRRIIKENLTSTASNSPSAELHLSSENAKLKSENSRLASELEIEKKKVKNLLDIFMNTSSQPNNQTKSDSNFFIDKEEETKFHTNPIKIGEGATSITYKVIDTRTKIPMCKKVVKYKSGQTTIKDAQNALKEFEIMYSAIHPCICKAIGINTQEEIEVTNKKGKPENVETIAIFLEYLEHGLSDVLNGQITNTLKVRVALEIAHAMNYLHKRGMMHRDLKIENIMMNSFYETKLVDFGLASISESVINGFSFAQDSLTRGVGTLSYMSPEMANEEKYDNKTDVYSFGVVLHVIFTGSLPKLSLKDKMVGKKPQLPKPSESITKFCINLISQCMSYKPSDRPSFEQILEQMRKNAYELAPEIDPSILSRRDRELSFIENYK